MNTDTNWVITNAFRPTPATIPPGMAEVAATWASLAPGHPADGTGDREDWIEDAYRLHTAVAAVGAARAWVVTRDEQVMRNAATGEERPVEVSWPRMGPQRNAGHSTLTVIGEQLADMPTETAAASYFDSEVFWESSGRNLRLVAADGDAILAALVDLAEKYQVEGEALRVRFKARAQKYAMLAATLPPGFTTAPSLDAIEYDDPYGTVFDTLVLFEGDEDAVLIYPEVPMSAEYRVFLVDGEPITGAGCIEEFTPLESRGALFDARTEMTRGDGQVRATPGLVEGYRMCAATMGSRLRAEGRGTCVLDLATGRDGRVLIVELNPLLNAGLYASRPDLVAVALARRPEVVTPQVVGLGE